MYIPHEHTGTYLESVVFLASRCLTYGKYLYPSRFFLFSISKDILTDIYVQSNIKSWDYNFIKTAINSNIYSINKSLVTKGCYN